MLQTYCFRTGYRKDSRYTRQYPAKENCRVHIARTNPVKGKDDPFEGNATPLLVLELAATDEPRDVHVRIQPVTPTVSWLSEKWQPGNGLLDSVCLEAKATEARFSLEGSPGEPVDKLGSARYKHNTSKHRDPDYAAYRLFCCVTDVKEGAPGNDDLRWTEFAQFKLWKRNPTDGLSYLPKKKKGSGPLESAPVGNTTQSAQSSCEIYIEGQRSIQRSVCSCHCCTSLLLSCVVV